MPRDSPGPLGVNDWAGFRAHARPSPIKPAAGVCACHRDITLAELCGVFIHRKAQVCEQFLPALNPESVTPVHSQSHWKTDS